VKKALEGKQLLEGKNNEGEVIWRIEKKYKGAVFNSPKSEYGKEIDVFVGSIGSTFTENLVDFDFFVIMAKEYGLVVEKIEEFGEYYQSMIMNKNKNKNNNAIDSSKMSDVEKEFSFLNNSFMFKKVSNAPDSVYAHLTKLRKTKKAKEDKEGEGEGEGEGKGKGKGKGREDKA